MHGLQRAIDVHSHVRYLIVGEDDRTPQHFKFPWSLLQLPHQLTALSENLDTVGLFQFAKSREIGHI
jgi:hypothetical protein